MISIYHPGHSLLHRAHASIKLLGLVLLSLGVFNTSSLFLLGALLLILLLGYYLLSLPTQALYHFLKNISFFLVILLFINLYLATWQVGVTVVLRLMILLLGSTLVTLTTKMSDLMDVLTTLLKPLRFIGVEPSRVSFCVLLSLRLIPMLLEIAQQVREVQSLRGADRNPFTLVIPILLRVINLAQALAESIDARGFEGSSSKNKQKS